MPVVSTDESGTLRIGELSRRTGLSPEVLRAWERRYALLRPSRTEGGFRLYSRADEERVRQMKALMASGLGAAQAARAAAAGPTHGRYQAIASTELDDVAAALGRALVRFDEAGANAALDGLLTIQTFEQAFKGVITPALQTLGRLWAAGDLTVAQEHFASNLLRGRLLSLARGWEGGMGAHALLACAPGELHDIALIAFGLALRRRGWRVTYLGQDTPIADVASTARAIKPALTVVVATDPARLKAIRKELAALAAEVPLALSGAGASEALARAVGARHLAGEALDAARALSGV